MKPVASPAQIAEMDRLEKIVGDGLKTFKEVGDALAEIWALKLYLLHYESFEEYCQKRWDIGTRRAYQLVSSAKVVDNVRTVVQIPNEAVARELSSLPPAKQISAAKVLAQHPGNITAAAAQGAVRKVLNLPAEDHPLPPPKNHPEMNLNLHPAMTPVAKAQAYSTISEWFSSHQNKLSLATPEMIVRQILALFK